MYEMNLVPGEILLYNKIVSILVNGNIHQVGLVLTNQSLKIFEDVNKKIEFQEVMRTTRGVSYLPKFELIFSEEVDLLEFSYDGDTTLIKTEKGTISVLHEIIPNPQS